MSEHERAEHRFADKPVDPRATIEGMSAQELMLRRHEAECAALRERHRVEAAEFEDPTLAVHFTEEECKGLRLALIFGVPNPEPAVITSARVKISRAERELAVSASMSGRR